MSPLTSIDDLLHPGESRRLERVQLDAQIRYIDQLLALLPSSAARPQQQQASTPMGNGAENGVTHALEDCTSASPNSDAGNAVGVEPRNPAAAISMTGRNEGRDCSRVVASAPTVCVSGRPSTPMAEGREIREISIEVSQSDVTARTAAGAGHGNRHITHGDGTAPRTGVNLIRVRNGDLVQAMVIYLHADCYEATELEYELGRPRVEAASPLEALHELREILEGEICTDGRARLVSEERRRDAAFARLCAGARL